MVTSKPRKRKTVYRHELLLSFQSNLENFIFRKTLNNTCVFHDHSLSVDEMMTRSVSCSSVIGMKYQGYLQLWQRWRPNCAHTSGGKDFQVRPRKLALKVFTASQLSWLVSQVATVKFASWDCQ
jgi:hypothetical protein